ncbi:MAG: dihydroorotate dehydrogenase electron transfer subunit [Promethearchaeota archaeon]
MNVKIKSWNKPVMIKIVSKKEENEGVFTFNFQMAGFNAVPGQFIMVWIPGVDEIPMSISEIDGDNGEFSITVRVVGDATKKLCEREAGELVGIRGPYGNGYNINSSERACCIIGGGVGIASVNALIRVLKQKGKDIIVINAAKSASDLIYHSRYLEAFKENVDYFVSTDDGSHGFKGYCHELLETLLSRKAIKIEKIYTCGPEKMMFQVYKISKKHSIPLEASLERMMRCGFGICGLCGLDGDGLLVCKDGPVFTTEQLDRVKGFGKYTREFSGAKKML